MIGVIVSTEQPARTQMHKACPNYNHDLVFEFLFTVSIVFTIDDPHLFFIVESCR